MLSQSGTSSSDYSVLFLLLLCITDYNSKGLYLKEQLKFISLLKNFAQKRLRPSEICIFSDREWIPNLHNTYQPTCVARCQSLHSLCWASSLSFCFRSPAITFTERRSCSGVADFFLIPSELCLTGGCSATEEPSIIDFAYWRCFGWSHSLSS